MAAWGEWPDLGAGRDRPGEDRIGVLDVERENDCRTAERWRSEHPQLGKLVRDVEHRPVEAQLDGHETTVGSWDPLDLLGAERVAVERGGALGTPYDDMRGDGHGSTGGGSRAAVLDVPAAKGEDAASVAAPARAA
jgi:hypothetical protein